MEEDEETTITGLNATKSSEDKHPAKVDNLSVSSDGLSDIGTKRLHNEDALYYSEDDGIWVVADGVGGHNAGDLASQSVVNDLSKFKPENNIDDSVDTLETILQQTNEDLVKKAADIDENAIIGSTVALLVKNKSDGALLWAGDSRVYRIRANEIELLTQDHSLTNEMIKQGKLDPQDIDSYPDSNKITRAVGFKNSLDLDYRNLSILPGDRYILCTDGLTKYLVDNEILSISSNDTVSASNRQLLQKALDSGGLDNITTLTVEFSEG